MERNVTFSNERNDKLIQFNQTQILQSRNLDTRLTAVKISELWIDNFCVKSPLKMAENDAVKRMRRCGRQPKWHAIQSTNFDIWLHSIELGELRSVKV